MTASTEELSAFKLQRHPENPVLLPDPSSDWEYYDVFNPAVIHDNGLFRLT